MDYPINQPTTNMDQVKVSALLTKELSIGFVDSY